MRSAQITSAAVLTAALTLGLTLNASAAAPPEVVGTWEATTTTNTGTTSTAQMSFFADGKACTLSDDESAMTSSGTWRGSDERVGFTVKEEFLEGGEVVFTIESTQRGAPADTWTSTGTTRLTSAGETTRSSVTTAFTRTSESPTPC